MYVYVCVGKAKNNTAVCSVQQSSDYYDSPVLLQFIMNLSGPRSENTGVNDQTQP